MGIAEAQISWICITEEDPWDVAIPQALTRGEVDLMPSFKKDESSMKAWPNVTWGPTMDNAYYQTIVRVRGLGWEVSSMELRLLPLRR